MISLQKSISLLTAFVFHPYAVAFLKLFLQKYFFMSENYNDDSIRTLDWKEHIRLRPGMYIGKLGDGNSHDDGIYVLLKEVIDNSILLLLKSRWA